MTFNESVGENEVDLLLKEYTKDGQFGQFNVDEAVVQFTPIPAKIGTFCSYFMFYIVSPMPDCMRLELTIIMITVHSCEAFSIGTNNCNRSNSNGIS